MTDAITSDSLDPSIQIEWLQKRIAYLENLLQSNRIPFEGSISSQPAQPVLPTTSTPGHTRFFYSLFRGRQDCFQQTCNAQERKPRLFSRMRQSVGLWYLSQKRGQKNQMR